MAVDVDLGFDRSGRGGTDIAPEDLIGQRESGRILVDAPDGSQLVAGPPADDPATLRIAVDGTAFERPWAEGYQIECLAGCP